MSTNPKENKVKKKLSNLAKRVEKAKGLAIRHVPGITRGKVFGCDGSKGDHYQVRLTKTAEALITPDETKSIGVIVAECNKYLGVGIEEACWGNCGHTICYHSLGAILTGLADEGKSVAFTETWGDAKLRQQLGGKIVKVVSTQGEGKVWGVITEAKKAKAKFDENGNLLNLGTKLMRLSVEEEEGID